MDTDYREQQEDPCGYVDRHYSTMSPLERNQMLTACANAVSSGSGPADEVAEYPRNAGHCLELTRPRLLGVFTDPNPELLVRTIYRGCLQDLASVIGALTMAEQAVERIDDWLDLSHVDDVEQLELHARQRHRGVRSGSGSARPVMRERMN